MKVRLANGRWIIDNHLVREITEWFAGGHNEFRVWNAILKVVRVEDDTIYVEVIQ